MDTAPPFEIRGLSIQPGTRQTVEFPVSVLSDHTPVNMSVQVVHGRRPGPTFFVSAAIHGDEIIGVEIVRRLLNRPQLKSLRGTLLAVPIVNSFGFINHSRYLPDRRDLNRSFPGSEGGSLAARLANLFLQEVVLRSNAGVDLHSAAVHRSNFPQIRVSPSRKETMELAEVFGAPMIMTAKVRPGSLRESAQNAGIDVLVFEGGESLRFDELAARSGVSGVLRVMHHLGMISGRGVSKPRVPSMKSTSSTWLRASAGGLLRIFRSIGDEVKKGEVLGIISDPFGEVEHEVAAEVDGVLISRTNLPVINEGDALFHIAKFRRSEDAGATIDHLTAQLEADPQFDEDEII